jgi:hypothetical protein
MYLYRYKAIKLTVPTSVGNHRSSLSWHGTTHSDLCRHGQKIAPLPSGSTDKNVYHAGNTRPGCPNANWHVTWQRGILAGSSSGDSWQGPFWNLHRTPAAFCTFCLHGVSWPRMWTPSPGTAKRGNVVKRPSNLQCLCKNVRIPCRRFSHVRVGIVGPLPERHLCLLNVIDS